MAIGNVVYFGHISILFPLHFSITGDIEGISSPLTILFTFYSSVAYYQSAIQTNLFRRNLSKDAGSGVIGIFRL